MRGAFALARPLFLVGLLIAGVPLFFGPPVFAYTSPGNASGYVSDFAGVLTPATRSALESELSAFDASTTNQIAVVTVKTLGDDYIENYAVKLFEEWKIGTNEHDNGVLLLVVTDDHHLRIEVGYGLEGALPDSVSASIINDQMVPFLKQGDYDRAVTAGVHAIEQATQGEYQASAPPVSSDTVFAIIVFALVILQWVAAILGRSKSIWAGGVVGGVAGVALASLLSWWLVTGLALTLGLVLLGVLFDFLVSGAYTRSRALGLPPPWWGGGRGGLGGGGGFGGFGGGSSGGGGASGSW